MNISNQQTILTVSQVTQSIKRILETEYRFVRISGEISSFKTVYSGHSYFLLKDHSAQLRAVLFKQQKRFVDLNIADGQEVVCFGRITVYEPRGDYQLVVDSVELYGQGKLQIAFEQLKQSLSAKGYFSPEIKKKIPKYPKKIVVITSPTGAAFHDFLKIFDIRKSPAHIQLFPVRVQGEEAAGEIAKAINTLNRLGHHEVIVLCRGGGSIEDLWAFNDEKVADAIFKSNLPIVTGVGHEIDFTIADFCSDLRCPTPTSAAEKLSLDNTAVNRHLKILRSRLLFRMKEKLCFLDQQLRHQKKMLAIFSTVIRDEEHRLDFRKSHFIQAIHELINKKNNHLLLMKQRLQTQAPIAHLKIKEQRLQILRKVLVNSLPRVIEKKEVELGSLASLLNSVSPLATLDRGYSITRKFDPETKSHRVIRKSRDVLAGDKVNIMLYEGELDCVVTDKK